ncbi:MAG: hypothetical protein KJ573_12155 [Proteobacteria bacterium]|nr:hypothetical protein [Pseudomonadota bacterium]MBU1904329.1 hypothetical protein [Pseudomonadota bacterium]
MTIINQIRAAATCFGFLFTRAKIRKNITAPNEKSMMLFCTKRDFMMKAWAVMVLIVDYHTLFCSVNSSRK